MRLIPIFAAALLALGGALPAAAQTPLAVPATSGWKHAQTGLILRKAIAGLPRTELVDGGTGELDIMAQYGSVDDIAVTIYLFRPALMSVPMWFGRSEDAIQRRDMFGGVTPQGDARAFAPPRGTALSALRRSYVPRKPGVKSTALAMMPMGEWLVAVRISSPTIDAAAIDAKLTDVIAGIGWPEDVAEAPAAAPIAACTTPIAFAKRAKLKPAKMEDALMGSLLAGMAGDKIKKDPEAGVPIQWCQEGAPTEFYTVYRGNESTNSYLLAAGDAGRTLSVSPAFALDGKEPGYQLSFNDLDRTMIYPSFDKLPAPDKAIEALQKAHPISSSTRGGKDITINM